MALTHEFAVIQGPPGTGKTYLGVKVAKALIENIGCRLLLVSYTNHALDQFLEAILPFTNSIVRIGGQSKNKAMEEINLNTLRRPKKKKKEQSLTLRNFYAQRESLKELIHELSSAQKCIDSSDTFVLSYESIRRCVPESKIIGEFYKRPYGNFKDPLCCWLFESVKFDFNEPITLESEANGNPNKNTIDKFDNRQEVTLDDFETKDVTSFSIEKSQEQLMHLSSRYGNSNNKQKQSEVHREIIILRTLIRTFQVSYEQKLYLTFFFKFIYS